MHCRGMNDGILSAAMNVSPYRSVYIFEANSDCRYIGSRSRVFPIDIRRKILWM